MKIKTGSYEQTCGLGKKIGANIAGGGLCRKYIITLDGELGSGKTAFVSGLARGLGIDEHVLSPSFTIVKEYSGGGYSLYHIDLYRLSDASELMSFDFYEYVSADDFVTAIEWAGKFGDMNYLPDLPTIKISISQHIEKDENLRTFKFDFINFGDKLKNEITAGLRT
jgi:tRNA threonylcarbamoyladenosine biosynthesis protein TsaE